MCFQAVLKSATSGRGRRTPIFSVTKRRACYNRPSVAGLERARRKRITKSIKSNRKSYDWREQLRRANQEQQIGGFEADRCYDMTVHPVDLRYEFET